MPTFSIDDSPEIKKHIKDTLEKAAQRAILSTAIRLIQYIQTYVIPTRVPMPVDRGAYRAGWRYWVTEEGADIFNTLPYASIIEYGARAQNIKVGRKMLEALEEWVKRKGFLEKDDDPKHVAWAIAMSMKKKGIFAGGHGLRVLERALKMVEEFLYEEWVREAAKG